MKKYAMLILMICALGASTNVAHAQAELFNLDKTSFVNGVAAKDDAIGHSGIFSCDLDDFSVVADWGDGVQENLRKNAEADQKGVVHATGKVFSFYTSHAYNATPSTALPISYSVTLTQHAHCVGTPPRPPNTKTYAVLVNSR